MSYQSEILLDSPALYYRLDQLGLGVDGELVPDLSGNALDAELVYSGTTQPAWGHTSPIETDPASRELWTWTNGGGLAYNFVGESRVERASDPLMAPAPKDFTIEQWVKVMAEPGIAGTFATSQKQGTGGIAITFNGGWRISAFCFDSAATLWLVSDMSFRILETPPEHLGETFHVVAVRSGDALAIYVNGLLRNFTTITSGLPTLFNSSPFRIHPASGVALNFRHDEVAYYTYALSAARILVHYEAALNSLSMAGECAIRTSATLSGADDPDPAAYSFRHNWMQPVIERFRARTGVFKPVDGSTQLTRQRSNLRRQVEYQHLLYSEKLRRQFEARVFAGRTTLAQFEPDKVRVEGLVQGATTAALDTRYRDFEAGQYVLVYQDDEAYEFQLLTSVTDTGIEWQSPLTRTYTRPWLKPARVARLPVSQSVEMQNDIVADSSTIYEYRAEDEPFSPRRLTPFTPTLTYHGREMFDTSQWQSHDYNELPTIEYLAPRSELDDGTGITSTKQYQWGADTIQPYNMNLSGREMIAKYLGWLYYRAGQYQPFWMPTFKQDLRPLARSGNVLLVEGHEYSQYYASASNRADLAFIYLDGTTTTRRIESFVADEDNDALTLDSNVPILTGLRWLSFLRRVILSSDDLEIAWQTDEVVRVVFAVTDAPLDIAFGSPSVSPSPSTSLSHSVSPSGSASLSLSPSASASPSGSTSPTISPSPSLSPSNSFSPSV